MNRERRIGAGLLAAAVFIILAVGAVFVSRESRALYYTVVFKDAKGLQPGDRVEMSGVNIGVVKWVELKTAPNQINVRLKIDPQYAEQVRLNSTAVIRDVSFPNVSGQRVVEVVNADGTPGPPLPRNSIVRGVGGPLDLQLWKMRGKMEGSGGAMARRLEALSATAKEMTEQVKQFAASPQVREAIQTLRAYMLEMVDKGRSGVAYLQEQWPKVKEKVMPVLRDLEMVGKKHVAEELQQMVRQIETTLDEWKRDARENLAPSPEPASP